MSMMIYEMVQDDAPAQQAVIKVIGVGGGGCNAVNNMIIAGVRGVEFIAANTDADSLAQNRAPTRIQLGQTLTKGLGAGSKPEVGRNSALEDRERIADACTVPTWCSSRPAWAAEPGPVRPRWWLKWPRKSAC